MWDQVSRARLRPSVRAAGAGLVLVALAALFCAGMAAAQAGPEPHPPASTWFAATEMIMLEASEDAGILQGYPDPDSNLGGATDMWVGYDDYLDPDGKIARGLLRFPPPEVLAGLTVVSATLSLYHINSWDFPSTRDTITACGVLGDWQESTVVWSNAPAVGPPYGSVSVPYEPDEWRDLDVTALVSGWLDGSIPYHGVYLVGDETSGAESSWRSFSTREGEVVGEGYAARLIVAYALPATATPTSTPTNTPSATSSPSVTVTATRTATPTRTATATSTAAPTATATATWPPAVWLPTLLKR